jgi:hypothetical protein
MSESSRDIRKAQRHSARAIPVYAALLVLSALLLWLAGRFVTVPVWLIATVIGLTAFTLVGDMVNVVCCEWWLRRRGPSTEAIQRTRSAVGDRGR